jgi:hypothetical protein
MHDERQQFALSRTATAPAAPSVDDGYWRRPTSDSYASDGYPGYGPDGYGSAGRPADGYLSGGYGSRDLDPTYGSTSGYGSDDYAPAYRADSYPPSYDDQRTEVHTGGFPAVRDGYGDTGGFPAVRDGYGDTGGFPAVRDSYGDTGGFRRYDDAYPADDRYRDDAYPADDRWDDEPVEPAAAAPADEPAATPATGYRPAAYPAAAARREAVRVPAPGNRRNGHRKMTATTAKGNTVVSATAALGAVVTGGLLASQATGPMAADAADTSHAQTSMMAASAIAPLDSQPTGHDAALSSTPDSAPMAADMVAPSSPAGSASAVTAVLPIMGARDEGADQRDVESLHKGEQLAQQAAAVHAAAVREASILSGGGGLDDWISVALDKLGMDQSYADGVKRVIMKESRGNPKAINLTDSNAMAGRPSQGLMQVIPSTFRAYVLPSLKGRPITDPVANITAGIRYMLANYGTGTLRQGGRYVNGSYVGY